MNQIEICLGFKDCTDPALLGEFRSLGSYLSGRLRDQVLVRPRCVPHQDPAPAGTLWVAMNGSAFRALSLPELVDCLHLWAMGHRDHPVVAPFAGASHAA